MRDAVLTAGLASLLKLNQERYAEKVEQRLHERKKPREWGTASCSGRIGFGNFTR